MLDPKVRPVLTLTKKKPAIPACAPERPILERPGNTAPSDAAPASANRALLYTPNTWKKGRKPTQAAGRQLLKRLMKGDLRDVAKVFAGRKVPLVINADVYLKQRLDQAGFPHSRHVARWACLYFSRHQEYLEALLAVQCRYDLDGRPVRLARHHPRAYEGHITDTHRQYAQQQLDAQREHQKTREKKRPTGAPPCRLEKAAPGQERIG